MRFNARNMGMIAVSIFGFGATGVAIGCKPADSTAGAGGAHTGTTTSTHATTGTGTGATGSTGTGTGTGSSSTGTGGGMPVMAVLCPDKNAFMPGPNSVQVTDAILSKDTTWTADKVWLVMTSVGVEKFTLTIEAGTVVCFANSSSLHVGDVNPGELHINGTKDKHVVFTSTSPDGMKPDFFGGLYLNQYMASTVANLDIFYGGIGGGGSAYALQLSGTSGGTDPKAGFLFDHVTVGHVQSKGIEIAMTAGLAKGSVVEFNGFHPFDMTGPALVTSVHLDITAAGTLDASMLAINTANIPKAVSYISLDSNSPGTLGTSVALSDLGLPYRLGDLDVFGDPAAPTLTINAGVTMQLNGKMEVGDHASSSKGNLVLAGTAGKPVVFTSSADAPAPGDWDAIAFIGGNFDPQVSKIDNAQILFGGSIAGSMIPRCGGDEGNGTITIDGIMSYDGPSITNTLIANSATDGIRALVVTGGNHITNDYSKGGNTFMKNAGVNYPTEKACP